MARADAVPALSSPPGPPVAPDLSVRRARLGRLFPLLVAGVLITLLAATALAGTQADADPVLAITNISDEPVEVYVGGDRVRIIAGHDTEYLDLPPAIWAWPRRIEARRWPNGELLFQWRADLSDLAGNHWRLRIP
jgi:hypothetical protein